jgi:hypothetical protein
MNKVKEFLFRPVHDPVMIQAELKRIAVDEEAAGQKVSRGMLGSVVVELDDGEVHYVPSGRGVECVVFSRKEVK